MAPTSDDDRDGDLGALSADFLARPLELLG